MKPADLQLSDVVDFELLSERLEGDTELMREMAALYIEEYPKQFEDLQNAVHSSDLPRIQCAAHKIKGTARSFAAAPAAESARELEETLEIGDGRAISEMVERLSHELRRLQFALEEYLTQAR